ncbi:hypothetical protein ABZ383_36020, partial [Streptomyces sp. NPDC005900]|uniref:hypothetical protein n=1 Tax=Streptomyces sp. NPDC005900 TaxID=3154569 RepID=UPI0033FD2E97
MRRSHGAARIDVALRRALGPGRLARGSLIHHGVADATAPLRLPRNLPLARNGDPPWALTLSRNGNLPLPRNGNLPLSRNGNLTLPLTRNRNLSRNRGRNLPLAQTRARAEPDEVLVHHTLGRGDRALVQHGVAQRAHRLVSGAHLRGMLLHGVCLNGMLLHGVHLRGMLLGGTLRAGGDAIGRGRRQREDTPAGRLLGGGPLLGGGQRATS